MTEDKNMTSVTRTRQPPILTTVGKRQVISTGRWNDVVIADYILANGSLRWIEISELAKIAYGHNNNDTKTKVRRYLHKIKVLLIDRNVLMVTEYEPQHKRAVAVKLFDQNVEADRQQMQHELIRMRRRGELSVERYERALLLLANNP